MVDLETLGTSVDAVVISISAVQFNPLSGKTLSSFEGFIDYESVKDLLTVSSSTLSWWMSQTARFTLMRKYLLKKEPLHITMEKFYTWLNSIEGDPILWGNGATFDLGKLDTLHNLIYRGSLKPWKYSHERDVRTLVELHKSLKYSMPFNGIPHDGLDDCKHQIKYISSVLNSLEYSRSSIIKKLYLTISKLF